MDGTLITGNAGCGKTRFATSELVYKELLNNHKVVIVTNDSEECLYWNILISNYYYDKFDVYVDTKDVRNLILRPEVEKWIKDIKTFGRLKFIDNIDKVSTKTVLKNSMLFIDYLSSEDEVTFLQEILQRIQPSHVVAITNSSIGVKSGLFNYYYGVELSEDKKRLTVKDISTKDNSIRSTEDLQVNISSSIFKGGCVHPSIGNCILSDILEAMGHKDIHTRYEDEYLDMVGNKLTFSLLRKEHPSAILDEPNTEINNIVIDTLTKHIKEKPELLVLCCGELMPATGWYKGSKLAYDAILECVSQIEPILIKEEY